MTTSRSSARQLGDCNKRSTPWAKCSWTRGATANVIPGGDQPSLLAPVRPRHEAATDTVRVLAFNAQHACASRSHRQAAWIAGQEAADVVVITEVGSGPGGAALV